MAKRTILNMRVDVRVRTYTRRLCIRETTYTNMNDNLIFDDLRFNIMDLLNIYNACQNVTNLISYE